MKPLDLDKLPSLLAFQEHEPLLFNTGLFLLLLLALLFFYQAAHASRRAKMCIVILFSLYFYYKSSAIYCLLLLLVCVSDFVLGLCMARAGSVVVKKLIIALNVCLNVGMLIYFKYFRLLAETFASITGSNFDVLNIILPAGISFFTFRSISYLVDIYRGHLKPATNFLDYLFLLTFFPPLLAGPVVRAKDLLPQIQADAYATRQMTGEGLFLIISGIIKKVIVADYLSGNFVDRIFENPSLYTGFENMLGIVGFTVQIYCDFSGYSDMAIGLALLLGYRLKDNFNSPFKSQSPTEFWKRWHISLSSWLMDYLYIPLGGNRKGKPRQYANLMATMLIGGIWHGASWMYLIWGGYHGALLIGHKALKKHNPIPDAKREKAWAKAMYITLTFVLVAIGFMFFRAESPAKIGDMVGAIFTNFHPEVAPQFISGYLLVTILLVLALALHFMPDRFYSGLKERYIASPIAVQAIVLAAIIFLAIQMRQTSLVPFIYMQY